MKGRSLRGLIPLQGCQGRRGANRITRPGAIVLPCDNPQHPHTAIPGPTTPHNYEDRRSPPSIQPRKGRWIAAKERKERKRIRFMNLLLGNSFTVKVI